MVLGHAPDREHYFAIFHANWCKNFQPTKANRKGISPMAAWEGNDKLSVPPRAFKAPLFCLVNVKLYKEERAKFDAHSYDAIYLGLSLPYGRYLVRSLENFKVYHAADLHVHPQTFPYLALA